MTNKITCPAEGCDYDGPAESVAGHAQAKRDSAHKGISYRNVMDEHAGNGGSSRSNSSASSPSSTSTSGDNPTVGDGDSGGGGNDGQELPCGHDTFAWADVPDSAIRRNDGMKMTHVTCGECGQSWTVSDG
jgi:hypothetical protein